MKIKKLIVLVLILVFSVACSSSYKELSNNSFSTSDEFSKHLLNEYKNKADFEAKEMHDWNSAKLYSIKAIKSSEGKIIKPEKITKWKINKEKVIEILSDWKFFSTQIKGKSKGNELKPQIFPPAAGQRVTTTV